MNAQRLGTLMTRIERIFADLIRLYQPDPRRPRLPAGKDRFLFALLNNEQNVQASVARDDE